LGNVKKKNKNGHWGRCRIASEFVYTFCKLLHLKGDFKINIIHQVLGNDIRQRGHAWVTCDDKDLFLTPAYRPHTMIKIGESKKYRYWISTKYTHFIRTKVKKDTRHLLWQIYI